ncbi:MAG TPA: hypothetical protein VFY27_00155, partial [Woeseiaceae bacterium]|nr:hypothetical protein [Woeseiaceae bacterium]
MSAMSEREPVSVRPLPDDVPGKPVEPVVEARRKATNRRRQLEEMSELMGKTVGKVRSDNPFMIAENVNVHYGDLHAIKNVTLEIGKEEVVALIGPSG